MRIAGGMMLYIVVPTFNRKEIFMKFIDQMKAQKNQNWKLIVVDHGRNKTGYRGEGAIVIESDINGWSYAINIGLRYILNELSAKNDDHIMLINDDVLIKEDFVDVAYRIIQERPLSCVGSVCYDWNSYLTLHVNMILNKKRADYEYKNKNIFIDKIEDKFYSSDVLKGRGTIYPVEVFRKIGLMNEKKLPMYRADHEMAYRAKLNGYEVCVYGKWVVGAVLDSPKRIDYKLSFSKNYNNLFKNMLSVQNTKDLWNYSHCCFSLPYAIYYYLVNWLRTHTIFVLLWLRNKHKGKC